MGASSQYADAINNARTLDKEVGISELTFVGHSLGGGLGAASSMATGRAAITFNRASVSWRTSLYHGLGSVDNVKDYILVKKSGLPGISFYEPVTAVQRLFKMQTKGHHVIVPVDNAGYIDSHKIKSVVDNIERLR